MKSLIFIKDHILSYEEENRNCNDDNPKLFKKSFPCSLKVLALQLFR